MRMKITPSEKHLFQDKIRLQKHISITSYHYHLTLPNPVDCF